MGRFYPKVPDTTKRPRFPKARVEPNQYSEPAGPARQPTFADKIKAKLSGINVGQTLSGIHDNLEASAARERSTSKKGRGLSYSALSINPPQSWMMGMGPAEPERAAPAPRKGKKKKKPRAVRKPEPTWQDLSAIPASVRRWM